MAINEYPVQSRMKKNGHRNVRLLFADRGRERYEHARRRTTRDTDQRPTKPKNIAIETRRSSLMPRCKTMRCRRSKESDRSKSVEYLEKIGIDRVGDGREDAKQVAVDALAHRIAIVERDEDDAADRQRNAASETSGARQRLLIEVKSDERRRSRTRAAWST